MLKPRGLLAVASFAILVIFFQNFTYSKLKVVSSLQQGSLTATSADYGGEANELNRACAGSTTTCQEPYVLNLVRKARATSNFTSGLNNSVVENNLSRTLGFVLADYRNNLSKYRLRLPFNLPSGQSASGTVQQNANSNWPMVFWLGDNGIYVEGALLQFAPSLGRMVHDAYVENWNSDPVLGKMCPTGQSHYVIGVLPENELYAVFPTRVSDSRCQYPIAGSSCNGNASCQAYMKFKMQQTVNNNVTAVEVGNANGFQKVRVAKLPVNSSTPILGTDHEQGAATPTESPFTTQSPRDLFKYGCLRQVMTGHPDVARTMFAQGIDLWVNSDSGFASSSSKAVPGTYDTRDLAFALICANAIGYGDQHIFHGTGSSGQTIQVRKSVIEQALWDAQGDDGGLWSNYATAKYCSTHKCFKAAASSSNANIPGQGKETEEITPLALLAYGQNIWRSR